MANRYAILSVLTVQEATRFWSRILTAQPDECWLWQSTLVKKGYGGFPILRNGKTRILAASRVAYALHYGVDPAELDVLHKCDNPPCCNPLHLFLGTNAENIQDRIRKGRSAKGDKHWSRRQPELTAKGESHGRSKLRESQVISIRQRHHQEGASRKQLAQEYGVSVAMIDLIVARKSWTHI